MEQNLDSLHAAFAGSNGGAPLPPRSVSIALLGWLGSHLHTIWTAYVRSVDRAGRPPML